MSGARTLVILYMLIGVILAIIGVLGAYLVNTGVVVVDGTTMQMVVLLASIVLFVIGLHWVVVGIASLRGASQGV
ncbi:hypothetical protein [Pyrodictium delaneyi]|uniref:Uncharacterized protein n=1 Tax=Pyrodictium delaneyi TaxID=1273541 RepID=A0A211YRJ9_9CREN|nr:hypothetical protein [Pyrodictium delaneyi]OWJ55683.1 hypothetical protein Pdsh_02565 [Pyrodictium delaneyi]